MYKVKNPALFSAKKLFVVFQFKQKSKNNSYYTTKINFVHRNYKKELLT